MNTRPNILLLYTDQQRWDSLGAHGNHHARTPHLDRLAAAGASFDHCFCQSPLCMPSRASFLTGQLPSQLGITHMGVPLPQDVLTWPRLLAPYGYRSASFGKLHFLPHANRDHRAPHPLYGFDQLEISDEPGVYEDAYRAWVRRVAPDQLPHLSAGLPPATAVWQQQMGLDDAISHPGSGGRDDFAGVIPFPGRDDVTHAAFVAERTLDFLQGQRGQRPFFCIASFFAPHAPWVVAQRFLDLFDPAASGLTPQEHGYLASVAEVDHHVGRTLDALDAQGLADNTIVVFTSDHGEWLGDHGRFGKGYPGDDPVTRVPLIVRWPDGLARPGTRFTELIESVDVLPTLLDALGIQPPLHLAGRSFVGLLQDAPYTPRAAALTEFTGWKTLRTADHRYLIHADGSEQLTDPAGNVVDDTAVLAEHRRLLLQRLLEGERPLARTWPY